MIWHRPGLSLSNARAARQPTTGTSPCWIFLNVSRRLEDLGSSAPSCHAPATLPPSAIQQAIKNNDAESDFRATLRSAATLKRGCASPSSAPYWIQGYSDLSIAYLCVSKVDQVQKYFDAFVALLQMGKSPIFPDFLHGRYIENTSAYSK